MLYSKFEFPIAVAYDVRDFVFNEVSRSDFSGGSPNQAALCNSRAFFCCFAKVASHQSRAISNSNDRFTISDL